VNIGSLIRGLLGDSKAGEPKSLELKEGQIVRGVVLSLSESGKEAVVQIQGTPVRAELETPLQVGQTLNLQVSPPGEGGLPVLKPVSLGEAALVSPQSMGEALDALGLTDSKAGREIVRAMQAGGLDLTRETAAKLNEVMSAKPAGVPAEQWLEAAVISVKRGLPVTAESVKGLQQAIFGPPLHELLSSLEEQITQWAGQQNGKSGAEGTAGNAALNLNKTVLLPGIAADAGMITEDGPDASTGGRAGSEALSGNGGRAGAGNAGGLAGAGNGAGNAAGLAGANGAGNAGGLAGAGNGTGNAGGLAGAGNGTGNAGGLAGAGNGAWNAGGLAGAGNGTGRAGGLAGANGAGSAGGLAGADNGTGSAGGLAGAGNGAGNAGGLAGAGNSAGNAGGLAGAGNGTGSAGGLAGANGAGSAGGLAGANGAGSAGGLAGANGAGNAGGLAGAGNNAARAEALLAKLQGVLTELRGTLPQLAALPPAGAAGADPAPAAGAPRGETSAAAAQPQQSTPATRDTESWVGRVLKLLGAEHEQQAVRGAGSAAAEATPLAQAASKAGAGGDAADTLKGVLLQVLGSSEMPPALKEAAGQLVQQLTGQQLLLNTDRTAPFAQVTLFLPLHGPDGEETASVHIQSRRGRKGELDAANCRLWFDLQMKQLGQTLVDVQVVDHMVSLKLHNDDPWVLELLEDRREEIKTAVESIGYQLSGLKTEPLPAPKPADAEKIPGKLADFVPDSYKGVDFRV